VAQDNCIRMIALNIAFGAIVGPSAFVSDARAQEGAGALEEVVVTARRREENLQQTPLAVTAFSAEAIDRAGFQNLEQVSRFTPGLSFNNELSGFRPGRLYSSMRFRGVEGSQFSTLQTASLFIDGIFALQAAQSLALTDIERVEVIKGPQSAIFGRNSFAGAINYVTRTPSLTEYSGKLAVDAGTHDQYEVAASYEGPLIADTLSFRVGVRSYQKGSMYTASDGGKLGEQSSNSVFATLYAKPTENLTVRLRGFYQKDDDGPEAAALMYFQGAGASPDTCTGTSFSGYNAAGVKTTLFPKVYWCGRIPNPGQAGAPPVDMNTSLRPSYPSFASNPNFLIQNLLPATGGVNGAPRMDGLGLKRLITRASLETEYKFKNDAVLAATFAYNENKAGNIRDFDETPIEAWWVTNPQVGTDKSVDLRVTSSGAHRFRWLAGANFYKQEFLTSANAGVLAHACGNFAGIATGNFCSFPGLFPVGNDGGDFAKQASLYGSVSYDITDKWTVDLEGRYQEDKRSDGVTSFDKTYYAFIPRVTLTYKPTPALTVYGLATQGVLPGVINANYIACSNRTYTQPFADPQTGLPSTLSVCEQYRKQAAGVQSFTKLQTLDAVELGIKTTWADGRAIANLAVYYQKWNDQPSTQGVTAYLDDRNDPATGQVANDGIPNLTPNFFSVAVSGGSKYSGAELETAFYPSDRWSMNAAVSYNKNEFTEFSTAPETGKSRCGTSNYEGFQNARFPEWTGSLSSTYRWPLAANWSAFARGDVTYNGKAPADRCNRAWLQDYFLASARIGAERDSLRVEFYVKNLFNETTWVTGNDFADFTRRSGTGIDFGWGGIILIPQDKRTFGLKVSYDF
jgi:iron complex outermembrane receptor protein